MNFSIDYNDILKETTLVAAPEDYDGYPTPDRLIFEQIVPHVVPADRILVAGCLAFSNFTEGSASVNQREISRPAAEAVENFFNDARVRVTNVTLRPREPYPGSASFVLSSDARPATAVFRSFDEPREIVLHDISAAEVAGAQFSTDRLVVPSNATVLRSSDSPDDLQYWYPHVAIATLIAHAFGVRDIVLPSIHADRDHLLRMRRLLIGADLRLIVR